MASTAARNGCGGDPLPKKSQTYVPMIPPDDALHFRHGLGGVGHETHDERHRGGVECAIGERQRLRVGEAEIETCLLAGLVRA